MQHGPVPTESMQRPSSASLRGYGRRREPPVRRPEQLVVNLADPAELNHEARRMASAPALMTGA
jgi:hypothetical protein